MKIILRAVFVLILAPIFTQFVKIKEPKGDSDNGGLMLPEGFEALIVADNLGPARHLAVNDNGDIYIRFRVSSPKGSNIALRDVDNDGKADVFERFGAYTNQHDYNGTEMRIRNGYLYYSNTGQIFRSKLIKNQLLPDTTVELLLTDDYLKDPYGYNHTAKTFAFDEKGLMYVTYGSPGDVCQIRDRVPEQPGQYPCPQLDEHAGIWTFDPNIQNQTIKNGKRFATGIRSAVAITWNPTDKNIYVVQHGRDDMHRTWPKLYNRWQSAQLPAEEFLRVKEGTNAGWPYYYYDHFQGKKLLNPEYGGDGKKPGNGKNFEQPIMAFPGHWAPNDILFYTGNQFPERYKHGAFITFHGSTIRAPYSQAGYFVAFVPFQNGKPNGKWEVFADGFSGTDIIQNTSDAAHRPMGLAQGPDGSLFISDSQKGTIWRLFFKGDKLNFGKKQLAFMETRKTSAHIRTPHIINDNLEKGIANGGELIYKTYCVNCHMADGKGDGQRYPPLTNSSYINGDKNEVIKILLNGISQPVYLNGKTYNGIMPSHSFLSDKDISLVINYIRTNFENNSPNISEKEVGLVRKKIE
jgi:glucose/arabinose dehydrogenase/mono/diheme cytochrome c family protein